MPSSQQLTPIGNRYQGQSSTKLLLLPAEVRNNIYEYVIINSQATLWLFTLQVPALAQTCQQLRAEFHLMVVAAIRDRL